MDGDRLVFRVHAVQRMFERGISTEDVRQVVNNGELIEAYPDDTPYPSRLVLDWSQGRPIHVVVADNKAAREIIVVTAYESDAERWDPSFRRKRL